MNGQFHEIKGIFRANDTLKKNATLGVVTFWGPTEMKRIVQIVNKHNPKWRDEFVEVDLRKKLK